MSGPYTGNVLLINKPLTWTSFDVVNKLKGILKKNLTSAKTLNSPLPTPNLKIGHAGTLDPLATGLLIICVGKETKNIEKYQSMEKEYTGTFFIGATTACYDLEKPIDKTFPTAHITDQMIMDAVKKFTGIQLQTPPLFSAVKIKGQRAYDIARAGRTAEIAAKEITIYEFEIIRIALPEVDFRLVCSKGTYVRALARDMGEALGSGAHLVKLCRTRIGGFNLENALSIEQVQELAAEGKLFSEK